MPPRIERGALANSSRNIFSWLCLRLIEHLDLAEEFPVVDVAVAQQSTDESGTIFKVGTPRYGVRRRSRRRRIEIARTAQRAVPTSSCHPERLTLPC
jgi:hypothetical protein